MLPPASSVRSTVRTASFNPCMRSGLFYSHFTVEGIEARGDELLQG